jgi:hypothetical protein
VLHHQFRRLQPQRVLRCSRGGLPAGPVQSQRRNRWQQLRFLRRLRQKVRLIWRQRCRPCQQRPRRWRRASAYSERLFFRSVKDGSCQDLTGGPFVGPLGQPVIGRRFPCSAAVSVAVELWWLVEANACIIYQQNGVRNYSEMKKKSRLVRHGSSGLRLGCCSSQPRAAHCIQ